MLSFFQLYHYNPILMGSTIEISGSRCMPEPTLGELFETQSSRKSTSVATLAYKHDGQGPGRICVSRGLNMVFRVSLPYSMICLAEPNKMHGLLVRSECPQN